MKGYVAVLTTTLLVSACFMQGTFRAPTVLRGDTWIRDVTLVSPERADPLEHAHVIIREDRIVFVGDALPTNLDRSNITVVEGTGKFLTPGLIDGHVHLTQIPGVQDQAAMPELVSAYYQQLPRSYLYFGFTTLVDLNVVDRERQTQIAAAEAAPDIFDCGNGLPLANGYPMAIVPPSERFRLFPNFLYDSRQEASIPADYEPANHTPAAAVDRVAANRGVCVKSFYESGFDPREPRLPVPTPELMREVRNEAHEHRLPLLLHANSLEAHRFAADVDPDAVVHGLWNWGNAPDGTDGALPAEIQEVLDAQLRKDIAFMPTARVLGGLADLFAPRFLDDLAMARVVPTPLIAWYRTDDAQFFKREVIPGYETMPEERLTQIFQVVQNRLRRVTKYLADRGGSIAFGSDTPSAPTYANPPGYNGYLELRELESAGLSPRQVLRTATIENVRLFNLADYGTIQPGKIANLLLLRDDPLASTAAFNTIENIVLKGRVFPRETLAVNR